jgi:hypothetical protein
MSTKHEFKPKYKKYIHFGMICIFVILLIFASITIIAGLYNSIGAFIFICEIALSILACSTYFKKILIKSIKFSDDEIVVERYLYKSTRIKFSEIEYVDFSYIKTQKAKVLLVGIENLEVMFDIFKKETDIKLSKQTSKNLDDTGKQGIALVFTCFSFVVLIILVITSSFIPYHFIGKAEDAMLVWFVLFLIVFLMIRKKFKKN